MKILRVFIILSLAFGINTLGAQSKSSGNKDTLRLACLLQDAIEAAPEKSYIKEDTPDLKLVISSATDTTVRACIDGVVSTIQRDADGTWEIVFYHNDYWFWLSGLTTVSIRKNATIKKGQPIGIVDAGKKIELLMFDFETPVDPKSYFNCVMGQPK